MIPQKVGSDTSDSGRSTWNTRIVELDGLRGMAILLVLLYHYVKCSVVGKSFWFSLGLAPLRLFWSGVDLFFVLSGFLIGGILLDARNSGHYYRTFFGRRFHRILPLYYVWLALFALGLVSSSGVLQGLFSDSLPWWSYALFVQNFVMAAQGSMGAQWLMVTWSLAVEEQFYLVLPFLVRNLNPAQLERWVIAAALCAPIARTGLYLSGVELSRFLLPSCADCLGLGVLLALMVRRKSEWLGQHRRLFYQSFAVLSCGVLLLSLNLPELVMITVGHSWLALFYSNLLILVILKPGPIEKAIFRNPFLVWMGTVSYGIYMFHEGIRGLTFSLLAHRIAYIDDWQSVGITIVALLATFALAQFSWRVFEGPIVDRARTRYRYVTSS